LAGTWLKLDIGILQDVKIRKIRRMENGDTFFACWIGLLCHAMEHGSDAVLIADGVPADVSDIALICDVDESVAARALDVFADLKMIERTEDGIAISKFRERQSLDNLNRKRDQARERQARYREKRKAEEPSAKPAVKPAQKPVAPPAIVAPPAPVKAQKKPDDTPHADCIVVEKVWDEAFSKERVDGKSYDRTRDELFRDRKKIGPLIQKHGVDEVTRRVRAYFALPAQYYPRTVLKFVDKWNAIDTAGGPRRIPELEADYGQGWAQ